MKLTPALKLTIWYLAFVMLLSLSFSAFVYRVSVDQIQRGFRRPPGMLDLRGYGYFDSFEQNRLSRIQEAEKNVRTNLFLFNIVIFVAGGGLSYFLAKRTIRPIEEALEAQTRFTADASHELRTPLAALQSETEVALRDKGLTVKEARTQLESNLEEVVKVRAIIDSLLRLARQPELDMSGEPVSLSAVVQAAAERVASAAQQKHIQIEIEPGAAGVRGDKAALTELVVILLDNAVKYSPADTVIRVASKLQGRRAVVTVRDKGAGISAVDLPHIFDRFYRGDPSRNKQIEGIGLGLSIARQIAEAHHGSLTVTSRVGVGSTFIASFPPQEMKTPE